MICCLLEPLMLLSQKKIDIAKTLFNGDQGPDEEEPTEEEPITPPVNEIQ